MVQGLERLHLDRWLHILAHGVSPHERARGRRGRVSVHLRCGLLPVAVHELLVPNKPYDWLEELEPTQARHSPILEEFFQGADVPADNIQRLL